MGDKLMKRRKDNNIALTYTQQVTRKTNFAIKQHFIAYM